MGLPPIDHSSVVIKQTSSANGRQPTGACQAVQVRTSSSGRNMKMLISHSQLENHYVSWENSVDMFAIFTRYSDIESHIHTVTTTWKFQDPGCMTWSDDQAMIPI